MSKFIFLIIGFLFFTSCSDAQIKNGGAKGQSATINEVLTAEEFKAKLNDSTVQLIDVRTTPEIKGGKIDHSVQIDFNGADFTSELDKLDKSKPVMVYCASGRRSANTAEKLQSLGFSEVYDLEGGFNGWPYK